MIFSKLQLFLSNLIMIYVSLFLFITTSASESPETVIGAETIGVNKAFDLYQNGAVFIDVRDDESWSYGHIDGAIHLDFNQDEFVILYVSDALDKNTPIVFYCDSPLSTTSAMASFFAASWGYENVYYYRKGYYSWMAYDMPIQFQNFDYDRHIAETDSIPGLAVADKNL